MDSLPPLGRPPHSALSAQSKAKPDPSSRAREDEPEAAATRAQRDAARQIEAAAQSVEEARRDADTRIDQIHDYFDARSEQEYAREEAAFENQRLQGYQRLKELKRNQEKEFAQTQHQGDRELEKLTHYYRDTEYSTARTGDEKLRQLNLQQAREFDHAKRTKDDDVAATQDLFNRQTREIRDENEAKIGQVRADARQDYERIRDTTVAATERAHESFENKYQNKVKESDLQLRELEARAAHELRETRRDTTDKLAAYSSRQRDPFYRMQDMNVRLADDGDSYVLTATIPEHEQKHVSVSVKGNQLVLTGSRRSEERLDIAPGRTQGTNAFQSFLETFPIAWPVEANKLTREFDGDQLTVRVPKKRELAYQPRTEAKKPERARLERPQFPENLPHVSRDPYADDEVAADTPRDKKGKVPLA